MAEVACFSCYMNIGTGKISFTLFIDFFFEFPLIEALNDDRIVSCIN